MTNDHMPCLFPVGKCKLPEGHDGPHSEHGLAPCGRRFHGRECCQPTGHGGYCEDEAGNVWDYDTGLLNPARPGGTLSTWACVECGFTTDVWTDACRHAVDTRHSVDQVSPEGRFPNCYRCGGTVARDGEFGVYCRECGTHARLVAAPRQDGLTPT